MWLSTQTLSYRRGYGGLCVTYRYYYIKIYRNFMLSLYTTPIQNNERWGKGVRRVCNCMDQYKVTGMLCMQRLRRFDYGPICQLGDWVGSVWKLLPVVCISFIISPLLTTSLQGWHNISNAPWPLSLRRDTTKSMVDLEVLYSCEGWQSLDYIDCAQKWLQICVCLTNSESTNFHCHPAGGKWEAHSLHRGKGWSSSAWLEICYWCTAPWLQHFPSRSLASRVSVAILERMVVS